MPSGDEGNGFLVECYWPCVNEERVAALANRTRAAASERPHVNLVESILVPADGSVFWLFEGQEADVRAVAMEAGLGFERILESRLMEASKAMREERQ